MYERNKKPSSPYPDNILKAIGIEDITDTIRDNMISVMNSSLLSERERHCLNEDQSIEILKVFGKEQKDDSISETKIKEYNQKAKEHFGTTQRLSLAGYILTDGTLLKLSYDNWIRDIDHREIKDVLDVDTSNDASAAMVYFINCGNIRLMERCFEISRPLTDKQKPVVAQVIKKARNSDYQYMYVDIANKIGQIVKTFEYKFPSVSQVFSDINNYFKSIEM